MADPYTAAIGAVVNIATGAANRIQQDRAKAAFAKQNPVANAGEPILASVDSGPPTTIPHLLDRLPTGWHVVSQDGDGRVYESQPSDNRNIYLTCSSGTPINIKVLVY